MTPHWDPPPLFSSYLTSASVTSNAYQVWVAIVAGGLIALLSHWIAPLGSLLLCLAGGLLALCARRWRWTGRAGGLIAGAAAVPVLGAAVLYGQPTVWWLLCGISVVLAAHFKRPPGHAIPRLLCTHGRNAAFSASMGLASVLAIQLTLHYVNEHHEVLARTWTFAMGDARAWLENVALLGPKKLAVLLLILIATAIIAPSLNVIRNYRRVALVASHGLLALIVATSFVFFGNGYSRSAEWVARLSMAREHLGAIDKSYEEVVKTAAVEQTVADLDESQRKILAALDRESDEHFLRFDIRERLVAKLIVSVTREALTRHAEGARLQLKQSELPDEHRRSQEVIEAARQQVEQGEAPSRRELAALQIERVRAEAYRQEARGAIRQLLTDTLSPPLVGELVQSMMDTTLVRGRVPPTSRVAATSAMSHAYPEPPRISFDHMLSRELDELDMFNVQIPALVQSTGLGIQAERQAARDAAEARKRRTSGGGGGGGLGALRRSGGDWGDATRSRGGGDWGDATPSRGGSRFGVRGGSRFGVRGGGPLLTA